MKILARQVGKNAASGKASTLAQTPNEHILVCGIKSKKGNQKARYFSKAKKGIEKACLDNRLLHLLEVRLAVEVGRHDLGHERLEDVGEEEEDGAAEQLEADVISFVHARPIVCTPDEAAHKERHQQRDPQQPRQRLLRSIIWLC